MKKLYFILIYLSILSFTASAQSHIYLTSPGTSNVMQINQDGSGEVAIIPATNTPRGIELDLANGNLYFVDGQDERIRSSNLDGTGLNTVVNAVEPIDLALDLANQIIYFTDNGDDKIKKVKFDGTGLADVLTGLTNPTGIDFDPSLNVLFWCDTDDKTINSVNTDGTNSQTLFTTATYSYWISIRQSQSTYLLD